MDDPALQIEYNERFVSPLTYGAIAIAADSLLDKLKQVPSWTRARWQEAWPSDPEITFGKLLSTVAAIAVCLRRLDDEARQIDAHLN